MPNTFQIDESRQTEYNSNELIILQIGQLSQLIQESLVNGQLTRAKLLLRQYYTLIKPKLINFSKTELKNNIDKLFNIVNSLPTSNINFLQHKLQDLYDEIHYGADAVGLGATTKQSMSSIADDI